LGPSALDEPLPESEDSEGSGFSTLRIVFAVILLVFFLGAIAFSASNQPSSSTSTTYPINNGPDTVNVTQVVVNVPTNACNLKGITPGAFSVPAGTIYPMGWWLPWAGGALPCSVTSVISDTSGFSVAGGFPVNVTSGQTLLLFTISTPASYSGVLTLTVL
jgi:hypothetical protein